MKKTLRRLFFLFLLFGLPMAAGEIWARARFSEMDVLFSKHNFLYQDHPLLLWTLRPNSSMELDRVTYTTNSYGMRSAEFEVPKPEGKHRILLLGESSTMGAGVEQNQIYASFLRDKMDRSFEVVNAGTGAWTVYQSYTLLKHYGDTIDPDAIIVYHQLNDRLPMGVVDRNNYLYAVTTTDRTMIERREWVAPVLNLLLQSRLYLVLRKEILSKSSLPSPHQNVRPLGQRVPDVDREVAWKGILDWCKERDVYLLAVWPWYEQSFADDKMLANFIQKNNIPMVNVPKLATEAGYNVRSFLHDGVHPSVIGHDFLAQAMMDGLTPWLVTIH